MIPTGKCEVRECENEACEWGSYTYEGSDSDSSFYGSCETAHVKVCKECYWEWERVGKSSFSLSWKVWKRCEEERKEEKRKEEQRKEEERKEEERREKQRKEEELKEEQRKEKERKEEERKEKQRKEEERKEEQRRLEEMPVLRKLGLSSKVIHFLQENAKNPETNEEAIKKAFESGEIPLGFHDKLLWSKAASILNELPSKVKTNGPRLEKLAKEEREAKQRLEEIEEERRQLLEVIAAVQSEQAEIEVNQNPYEQIIASGYGKVAQLLAQPEEELAMATKTQFENDFNDFAAIDDDSTSTPKLSLIFNTFGLSANVIWKIGEIDGFEFLDSDVAALCNQMDITDFGEVKQLVYIQNMAKSGVYLAGQHEEHCPVCAATTAEAFKELLEEHAASNEDISASLLQMAKLGINGRSFLAMTPQDLSSYLKISDKSFKKSYSKAKRYLERFHREATME